jgi:uncharacterized protein (TIGR03083 family)
MEVADHIDALRAEGERMAAAAERTDPDAPVPTCPEWVVRDLVRHMGGVHRWATGYVAGARTEVWDVDLDDVVGTWPNDAKLGAWFRAGHAGLVDALTVAPADLQCWTFLRAPSPLAMWARRQAHETAIHRVDTELAAGGVGGAGPAGAGGALSPFQPSFAADGIDELLTCFVPRPRKKLQEPQAVSVEVRCTDCEEPPWMVVFGPEQPSTSRGYSAAPSGADCVVRGRAADLYLTLWNRADPDALSVQGDDAVFRRFLDGTHIR